MCEPATLGYLAFAMASTSAVMGHRAQTKSAEAQGEALNEAQYLEQNDLQRQQSQQTAAISDQMNQHAREALREMSTAQAIAGEYGGGNTADRGMAVMGVQQGERLSTIGTNGALAQQQTGFDSIASKRRSLSQLKAIQKPSVLGTALTIGSAAVSSAGMAKSMQTKSLPKAT